MIDRRTLLQSFAAIGALSCARASLASAAQNERRLVVVTLRGGLDGLAAAPPHGDRDYVFARGGLALPVKGTGALHDLDGFFGLHPSLAHLKSLYDAKELLVFHNIGSPYCERSHAEGQNVLQSGAAAPRLLKDGWLARAFAPLDFVPDDALPLPERAGCLASLFQRAGKLLADGTRVATLEPSGWDTHVNQGCADGQLAERLAALDRGIAAMQAAMGPHAWKKTAVVMATEFGRTVHPNDSGGTDHGTGSAAFLFGGAVQGGRVKAEWLGLSSKMLKDGRDQPARTDLRALFKGLLLEHLNISKKALEAKIFPDSASAEPLKGLIRG